MTRFKRIAGMRNAVTMGSALIVAFTVALSMSPILSPLHRAHQFVPTIDGKNLSAPVALGAPLRAGDFHRTGPVPPSEVLTTTVTLTGSQGRGALRDYLAHFGIRATAPSGAIVWLLTGDASAFEKAFGSPLYDYSASDGRSYPTFTEIPRVPPDLPVVAISPPNGPQIMKEAISGHGPFPPTYVGSISCPSDSVGLSPAEVQGAYNITPVLNQGFKGQGETIGIVDAYDSAEIQPNITRDLSHFSNCYGLPPANISYAYPVPGGNMNSTYSSGWGLETALDVEWAHATAPYARVVVAFSPNNAYGLYFAVDWLIATRSADVVSLSWGEPESGIYSGGFSFGPCTYQCNASTDGSMATLGPVFADAASLGVDVFVASGDCGANGGTPQFFPWYPASDPHAIGVGGTVLTVSSNNGYGGESAWSGTEPVCSNSGGSGGGFSSLPRPWWQNGPGFGRFANSTRGVPDVALTSGTALGMIYNDSTLYVEGTSDAAPQWAGLGAIIGQVLGTGVPGFLAPSFYRMLGSTAYPIYFHPILKGSNGFSAGFGWDPLTGIGTPNFSAIVRSLLANRTTVLATTGQMTLGASPLAGIAPYPWDPLPVNISVSPWPGMPSPERYQFYFGDVGRPYQESNSTTTSNPWADVSYRYPGAYVAFAVGYGAGANTSMSDPLVINVGNAGALLTTLAANTNNVTAGSEVRFTATASGGQGPYRFAYFFGDGTYESSWGYDGPSLTHIYAHNGSYRITVLSNDSSSPQRGGYQSFCLRVGGGSAGCPLLPETPALRISSGNATLVSEESRAIRFSVTFNGVPLANAQVNLSVARGHLAQSSAVTNSTGSGTIMYTAPSVAQTVQFGIYGNVTLPGYAMGHGEMLMIVNPSTGPSLVPSIYLSQVHAVSGASDGIVIGTSVSLTGQILPNASVTVSSTIGSLSMATSKVNLNGFLIALLKTPLVQGSNVSGVISASATHSGYTTDYSSLQFTVTPGSDGIILRASANRTSIPSMASTMVAVTLSSASGGPVGSNLSSIRASVWSGSISHWTNPSINMYELFYSSPPTRQNVTEILSFNVTANGGSTIVGNGVALVNVTWGHGPVTISLNAQPDPIPPSGHAILTVTVRSVINGNALDGALVVLNASEGQLFQDVVFTDVYGNVSVNFTAPSFQGTANVTVMAIGFVYNITKEMFGVLVSTPPLPQRGHPSELWDPWGNGEGSLLVVLSAMALATGTAFFWRRSKNGRKPYERPSH